MSSANDRQVAGNHYSAPVQHWDYVVANDLNYFEGQITKYVTRCRKKGNCVQDLEKAKHFLEKYIEIQKEYERKLAHQGLGLAPDPIEETIQAEIMGSRKRERGA
jgi:Protein of unknwon function (DUF3310)